jgi:hypothetical protein
LRKRGRREEGFSRMNVLEGGQMKAVKGVKTGI